MQQKNIRFESRKGVKIAHKHNALIQAGYDTIDRQANLLGHIDFGTLFSAPLGEVVSQVVPHIERVGSYGLIDDPAKVATLFKRLERYNGDESFLNIADRMCDDGDFPKQAAATVYQLWHFHGIKLPELTSKPGPMAEVRQGMLEILQHASDLSYRTIWETAASKDMRTAKMALLRAADRNVVYLYHPNGLCCAITVCKVGISTDMCIASGGQCVTGSTTCASAQFAVSEDCGCC